LGQLSIFKLGEPKSVFMLTLGQQSKVKRLFKVSLEKKDEKKEEFYFFENKWSQIEHVPPTHHIAEE
jgi:hypothetical protein